MSEYYGFMSGNRGETTRSGSIKSGMNVTLRSYSNDVRISFRKDQNNEDILTIRVPRELKVRVMKE